MKKVLLALFLLAAIAFAQGQTFHEVHYGFPGESLPAVDTIPVYFMVSNTESGTTEFIFTLRGWIARTKQSDNYNESFWMAAAAYLKEDKRTPLNANLIIWDSRPREISQNTKTGKQ